MPLLLALAYRPYADSSVPPLAAVEQRAPEQEWFSSDFAEAEARVEHWRALALFGILVALEGLFFSLVADGSLFAIADVALVLLGVTIFLVGGLIVPEIGQGFGWAILGAAATGVVVGIFLQVTPLTSPLSLGQLWSDPSPDFTENVVRTMQLGGAVLAASASLLSFWAERQDNVGPIDRLPSPR